MRRALLSVIVLCCFSGPLTALAQSTEAARGPSAGSRENSLGLRQHLRRRYAPARRHFERALDQDNNLHIARFNLACACARLGDMECALGAVHTYLVDQPHQVGRVLHDPDLEPLRQQPGFMEGIERRARVGRRRVRSLVFERREQGGDLFVIDEDGFGQRTLSADPEWREYEAAVSSDGRFVVYLATRFSRAAPRQMGRGHAQRDWSDVDQHGRLYAWRFDEELRIARFDGSGHRVIGTRVLSYRMHRDGQSVLFLEEPTDGTFRVRRAPLTGGEAETVAQVEAAADLCYVLEDDGALLVAEGHQARWASSLNIGLSRYRGGERSVLIERRFRRPDDPRVGDFQLCELSVDGSQLHLGVVRILLTGTPRIDHLSDVSLGQNAYSFRNVGSRGHATRDALFLTVVGESHMDEDEDGRWTEPGAMWQMSPLSTPNTNGMSADWWFSTRVVRMAWDGGSRHELSPERAYSEYGPNVAPDGMVALTQLRRRAAPWIVVMDRDGHNRRRVVPGQYPVWNPVARSLTAP